MEQTDPEGKGATEIKNTAIFVLFVIAVLGVLFAVSGKRSPRIPGDSIHAVISGEAACLECHGPGKYAQRKETHPPKDQCLVCHKTKRKVPET